jgi:hypothetical protein
MPTKCISLLLCAFLWPALAQDAVPSPESLLRRAIEAQEAQDAKGWKFTWREDEDMFPADKNGKPLGKSYHHTYENIMLEGENYRKLVLVDGKPPDTKMQKKIDAEMEKERADRKAHPGYHHSSNAIHFGDTATLERLFNNKVIGEEVVSGRKTWRIESEPKADYKPANQEEDEFMAWRRTTWYDQQGGILLKSLHVLIRAMNIYRPGTEMEMEWAKHGDAWLLERQNHPYSMKAILNSAQGVTRYRYYDYKKFEVESRIVE